MTLSGKYPTGSHPKATCTQIITLSGKVPSRKSPQDNLHTHTKHYYPLHGVATGRFVFVFVIFKKRRRRKTAVTLAPPFRPWAPLLPRMNACNTCNTLQVVDCTTLAVTNLRQLKPNAKNVSRARGMNLSESFHSPRTPPSKFPIQPRRSRMCLRRSGLGLRLCNAQLNLRSLCLR